MAQNAKSAAPAAAPAAAAPAKSSSKLLIIIVLLVVAMMGAGGWYFTKGKHDESHIEEVKVAPPKPPIFVALEAFTVNLQRETSDQYLQLGLTLKVFEPDYENKIKLNLPDIRSKILQLLTTKTATELLTTEGKQKLIREIISLSNASIGVSNASAHVKPAANPAESQVAETATHEVTAPVEKKGVVDVLFTSFIIQ